MPEKGQPPTGAPLPTAVTTRPELGRTAGWRGSHGRSPLLHRREVVDLRHHFCDFILQPLSRQTARAVGLTEGPLPPGDLSGPQVRAALGCVRTTQVWRNQDCFSTQTASQSAPPQLRSKQNDRLPTFRQNESRGAQQAKSRGRVCKTTGVKRDTAKGSNRPSHTPICHGWHPGSQDGLGQTNTGQSQAPNHRLWMISVTLGETRHHGQSPGGRRFLPVASGKPRPHGGTGPPH